MCTGIELNRRSSVTAQNTLMGVTGGGGFLYGVRVFLQYRQTNGQRLKKREKCKGNFTHPSGTRPWDGYPWIWRGILYESERAGTSLATRPPGHCKVTVGEDGWLVSGIDQFAAMIECWWLTRAVIRGFLKNTTGVNTELFCSCLFLLA